MYPVSRACCGWVCAHWWQTRQSSIPLHRQSVWAEWMPRRLRWWWSVPALPQRWQRQASRESTASLIQLAIASWPAEMPPVDLVVVVEPAFHDLSVVVGAAGKQAHDVGVGQGDNGLCGDQGPVVLHCADPDRPGRFQGDEDVGGRRVR